MDPYFAQSTLEDATEACRSAGGLARQGHHGSSLLLFTRVVSDCEVLLSRVAPDDTVFAAADELYAHALGAAIAAASEVCASVVATSKPCEAVRVYSIVLEVACKAQHSAVLLPSEVYEDAARLHAQARQKALGALPAVSAEAERLAGSTSRSREAISLFALVCDVSERVRAGLLACDTLHSEAERLHAHALERSVAIAHKAVAALAWQEAKLGGACSLAAFPGLQRQPSGAPLPHAETLVEVLGICKRALVTNVGTDDVRESARQLYRPALDGYKSALRG
ncbi:hypothetical protein T492DRAFT_1058129 [Pavlovales sp. CCMP2436]|nr:hypothetical protein T492DRAFT_1058129 [Pavlovales sp. CCMP2436]